MVWGLRLCKEELPRRGSAGKGGSGKEKSKGALTMETNGLMQGRGWSGVLAVLRLVEELVLLFLSRLRKIGLFFSLCVGFLKKL